MYFKLPMRRINPVLLSVFLIGNMTVAHSSDGVSLSVVPNKCVSLRKGQTCYQRVQFRWSSQEAQTRYKIVCLRQESSSDVLACWENETSGKFRYYLEAAETQNFFLVAGDKLEPVIGRTTVSINWVYDSRATRRGRWRLF